MASRRKHRDQKCEEAIRLIEANDWRVEDPPKGYYKLKCPCQERHMRSVHRTPSDPNYCRNLLAWIRRQTCMREGANSG